MDKSTLTSIDVQCMFQAQAERAFWMVKDRHLRKEMFDLNAASARLHQDQRASFCHDVTTDADKFENITSTQYDRNKKKKKKKKKRKK